MYINMILTIGNIKGGVGKSTLACNIAVALSQSSQKDILLIDGDQQGSSADFTQARNNLLEKAGFSCIRAQGKEIISQIDTMQSKFSDIIIDAGGQDNPSLRAGLIKSDQVLVPISPRSFETWALDDMVNLIEEAIIGNPKLKTFIVINLAFPRGSDNTQTQNIIRDDYSQFNLIEKNIVQRKVFSDTIGQGLSVFESKPRNENAIAEIIELLRGIGVNQNNIKKILE